MSTRRSKLGIGSWVGRNLGYGVECRKYQLGHPIVWGHFIDWDVVVSTVLAIWKTKISITTLLLEASPPCHRVRLCLNVSLLLVNEKRAIEDSRISGPFFIPRFFG